MTAQARRTPTGWWAQAALAKADAELAEVLRMRRASMKRVEELDDRAEALREHRDYLASHPLLKAQTEPATDDDAT